MAYQNVGGTPRFYIDILQYLKSLNVDLTFNNPNYKDLYDLDPTVPINIEDGGIIINIGSSETTLYEIERLINPTKAYFAILNHNMESGSAFMYLANPNDFTKTFDNREDILNASDVGGENLPYLTPKDGCTIMTGDITGWSTSDWEEGDLTNFNKVRFEAMSPDLLHIGALSFGSYYDMPVSPDLNLSMDIEFDGYENTKTLNGSTLTNTRYMGSPWWYDEDGNKREPWAVGDSTGISKRNGRRTWNLKFSYMSDKDLFASNYGSSTYAEEGSLMEIGYSPNDIDVMNWGQGSISDGDFNNDVAANTTPTTEIVWGTDSFFAAIDGTSTISGGVANVVQMSQADNETVEEAHNATYEWSSSIGTAYPNWRLYQKNVFKEYDGSLSTAENEKNKKIIYKVSFRAKYVDVENSGDFLQIGTGYFQFFKQPMTAVFETYEVEFSFDSTPSNDNDLSGSWADAFTHAHSNKLVIGTYPSGTPAATSGWENHFQIEWIDVKVSNPTDFQYTIDDDDSFSAQVLNKISHGQKFIFQPDNTNANPDQFAICVLDQDSFSMKRTAYNVYDISMKIKEVW